MKKLTNLLALCLIAVISFSQTQQVPLEEIQKIANRNAEALWGNVSPGEPIAYYAPNDEIIAYRFNYAINQAFPDEIDLKQLCADGEMNCDRLKQWGNSQFGNILVSARTDLPVFLEYSNHLSPEYAFNGLICSQAKEQLGPDCSLKRIYYLNAANIWYFYSNDYKEIGIKPHPPFEVASLQSFNNMIAQVDFFIKSGDYTNQWNEYLNNSKQIPKGDVFIEYYEECCPYYDWSYGCTPTAAAMLLAYWDHKSMIYAANYGKFVDYHFERTDPLQGGQCDIDTHVPNLQEELAIAMNTNLSNGSTNPLNIAPGYEEVTNVINGYSFTIDYHMLPTFSLIKNEINYNRPIHTDIWKHSTCGIGYNNATEMVAVHDTWSSSYSWLTNAEVIGACVVNPGGPYGLGVELISPNGYQTYCGSGNGENLYAGDGYEINWEVDPDDYSYVRLQYNTSHGVGSWTNIVENTPNDGIFDWIIPAGISSDDCRLKIIVHSPTGDYWGADGSFGDFQISPGGSLEILNNDDMVHTTTDPDYYQFAHIFSSWCAVGVRPNVVGEHWSIGMYSDNTFTSEIAYAWDEYPVNFVVMDGNHTPSSYRGIKVKHWMGGTNNGSVEFDGGLETLNVGSNLNITWPLGDIVEMYDVYLEPGHYGFELDITSGSADLDIGLYSSSGTAYYDIGKNHVASSENSGTGVDEYFSYNVTTADNYGFCVWSNDGNLATYDINITGEGIWLGNVSEEWQDPDNWSLNLIPDETMNVTIPDGTTYSPSIGSLSSPLSASCKNLKIESGATLSINTNGTLSCYGTLNSSQGQLTMNGWSFLNFKGSQDNVWRDDNQDDTYTYVRVNKDISTALLKMKSNSTCIDFEIKKGIFTLNENRILTLTKTGLNVLGVEDGGKLLMDDDQETIEVAGNIHFMDGSRAEITNGVIKCGGDFVVDNNSSYNINLSGENRLVMNGNAEQYINYQDGITFHVNNLTINKSGGVCYLQSSDLDINGNLWITNGTLSCEDGPSPTTNFQINIAGNWSNTVGGSGFNESTGRVIFDGDDVQDCSDETFNRLKLEKVSGSALRMDGTDVVCEVYNWESGAVNVLNGGSFTANDLFDDGIFGKYFLHGQASVINLSNYDGVVHLSGDLHIHNGRMNIYGGTEPSIWPWANDAVIEMDDGVLVFHDVSIIIAEYFVLTENITGGLIRTSKNLQSHMSAFTPAAGAFELYSSSDATLFQASGCTFHDIIINKTDSKTNDPKSAKSSTVELMSDITITNNLNFKTGELKLNGHTLTVGHDVDIHGILTMDNPSDVFNAGTSDSDRFSVHGDGTANLNEGVTNIFGIIETFSGCSFNCSLNNTVLFKGLYESGIYNYEPTATYGNIVLDKFTMFSNVDTRVYGPEIIEINGNLTLNSKDRFEIIDESVIINGNMTDDPYSEIYVGNAAGYLQINSIFTLNGTLEIDSGTVCYNGTFNKTISSNLINNGNFQQGPCLYDFCAKGKNPPDSKGLCEMNGTFSMTDGLFKVTYDDLLFPSNSINNISGGTIECGRSFEVQGSGVFQPTFGALKIIVLEEEPSPTTYIYCDPADGNYFYDLIIDSDTTCELISNIEVKNDFTIENGITTSPDTLWIGGNWTNNGGDMAFDEGTGTVIFDGSNSASILTTETFYNLTIDKLQTANISWDWWPAIVANELNINSGSFIGNNDAMLSVSGNTNINQGGIFEMTSGCELHLDDSSALTVADGAKLKFLGEEANGILVTNITTGTYSFDVSGLIEARYTIFENMDSDGINIGASGYVSPNNPDNRFNHCTFRKGAPAPSTLLTLNNDQVFIIWDPYFENTYGNTGSNVRKTVNLGEVTFKNYAGAFSGEAFEDDAYNRIHWEEGGIELALTLMLEGPYSQGIMLTTLNAGGFIPLNQPYNVAPWYYSGAESVAAIPNPDVSDWILIELRDTTDAASATSGTVIAQQAAFLLKDGSVVGLDGYSNLIFPVTPVYSLFTVAYHRNHIGIMSATPIVEDTGGVYNYDFSTGAGQVFGGANGHKEIAPGIWGMTGADGNADGQINNGDKLDVWAPQAGSGGYLSGDFNLDSQVNNGDKNDLWIPNTGMGGQVPDYACASAEQLQRSRKVTSGKPD